MSARLLIAIVLSLPLRVGLALAQPEQEMAHAQHWLGDFELSPATLVARAGDLASDDPKTRKAAIAYLTSLPKQALPAIQGRVRALRDANLDRPAAIEILEKLLQAATTGVSPDVSAPLGRGASTLLTSQRDLPTRQLVEATLLLLSLESMKVTAAGLQMAAFFDIAEGALGNELRRARARAGQWLLPALIRLRSDDSTAVKRWAQAGVRALGIEDAKAATSLDDAARVADVVLAYSEPLDYEAMPTLVRLTRDPRLQVRQSARQAVARFGQNAIWQLRELYEELTSTRANVAWDAAVTAGKLYAVIDRERIARAQAATAAGLRARKTDDLRSMQKEFAVALAAMPEHPKRLTMAEGFAEAGAKALEQQQYEAAERAYRTAVHLAQSSAAAGQFGTQLLFVRAEQALHAGIVDRSAYEEVLTREPNHAGAQAALDRISGREAKRQRERKRQVAAVAGMLLLAAALLFGRYRLRGATAEASA